MMACSVVLFYTLICTSCTFEGIAVSAPRLLSLGSDAAIFLDQTDTTQLATHSGALRKAKSSFFDAVALWKYPWVEGSVPLPCAGNGYTGPLTGIGIGAHGIVVSLHRGSVQGPKVVAKVWKSVGGHETIQHECNILKLLHQRGVPNIVHCEASCTLNGHSMIVLTPFIEGSAHGAGSGNPIAESSFATPIAAQRAVEETVRTAWSMLREGIVNADQGSNIFYNSDGVPTFFDMALAQDLLQTALELDERGTSSSNKQAREKASADVKRFLGGVLQKIPATWWKDGRAQKMFAEIGAPSTPVSLTSMLNFTSIFWSRYHSYLCHHASTIYPSSCNFE